MRVAIVAITERGLHTAAMLQKSIPQSKQVSVKNGIKRTIENIWEQYDGIICIMASGIVIRSIAGLINSKHSDPCVVVVDENAQYAVSLLSGHIGGGNLLARTIANSSGAQAVITTASDVSGHTSVDLWTVENNLSTVNSERLTAISARLLRNNSLNIFQENKYIDKLPDDFVLTTNPKVADIKICLHHDEATDALQLIPKIYYVGLGCRAGVETVEFEQAFADLEKEEKIDHRSIAGVASIDIKKEEKGLLAFAHSMGWPVRFYSKDKIKSVEGTGKSQKVYDKIGVYGVSEPAAILAASNKGKPGRIIVGKKKWKRITAAVAVRENCMSLERGQDL